MFAAIDNRRSTPRGRRWLAVGDEEENVMTAGLIKAIGNPLETSITVHPVSEYVEKLIKSGIKPKGGRWYFREGILHSNVETLHNAIKSFTRV